MKPNTIDDIINIKPLYTNYKNECHASVFNEDIFPDWRRVTKNVRINTNVVNNERCLRFQSVVDGCRCDSYGFPFICAINKKTNEWIAYALFYKQIDGIEIFCHGKGSIDDYLNGLIGAKFGFDADRELFCENY